MSGVRDYFNNDFPYVIALDDQVDVELQIRAGEIIHRHFLVRIHADYNANATFLSAYISDQQYAADLAASFLEHAEEVAQSASRSVLSSGLPGDPLVLGQVLRFTGRVFLYIDADVSELQVQALANLGTAKRLTAVVRGRDYANARTHADKPVAFLSYDSRDKSAIAKPLASRLAAFGCPVWFDDFALRIGDSLRESIERGLNDCEKCILVVSPHFLENIGWPKTEFNAIFTREIHEKRQIILPVWVGVTKAQVIAYSPTLADRYAVSWEVGLDEVVQEIRRVVGP